MHNRKMDLLIRIFIAFAASVVVYWIYRGGVYLGYFTTVRTAFYFSMHKFLIWPVSALIGFGTFMSMSEK